MIPLYAKTPYFEPKIEKEVDGVSSVKADELPNTATYNLAGQKVNAQYKGIVIRKGKKVMK